MALPEDYVCEGQLSLFDLFGDKPTEEELPELEKIIPIVESKFGVKFKVKEVDYLKCTNKIYYFIDGKLTVELNDSQYNTGDAKQGKRFVSVDCHIPTSGVGTPCDSLNEIVRTINYGYKRFKGEYKR